ncbi:MAG: hypothetical protein NT053_11965 [Cyanobacteria bacterium]|nr:hypothetical protein [Cyanobacteriota bacterium]
MGGANEKLLGEAFADRRDRVFIATKFGPTQNVQTGEFTGLDDSHENCRRHRRFAAAPAYRLC